MRYPLTACILAALAVAGAARSAPPLWTIGKEDGTNAEFALAPNGYGRFSDDGLYAVGHSKSRVDWPYVQPGPTDNWAGSRQHTYTVYFGLASLPKDDVCTLRLAILDAHTSVPPRIRIVINGAAFERECQAGTGDASVYGSPSSGRRQTLEVAFSRESLKLGINEISFTTLTGSWLLWDAISMDATGATLSDAAFTRVSSARSDPVLVRRGGVLRQVIRVPVVHYGPKALAEVKVGRWSVKAPLVVGRQVVDVVVPAVQRETKMPVTVAMDGKTIASSTVVLKPVRKWVVYLLPHSHVDIGYTALQADVLKKQFTNLETAIALARKTKSYPEGARFKWSAEVSWAVDAYLKQANKPKRADLLNAIRRGWIELDALYGNELTALCRPEELVHLVTPSLKLARQTGVPIRSAMITDVPGYTWGLVPVLAQAGVKYLSFGPNPGDRIGPTIQAWGDKPFYWISPAGDSSVLCWMAGTGYAWFHGQTLRQKGDAEMLSYLQGLADKRYPYDMVQVRYTTNGDNGPPDVTMSGTVKAWNERYAYPKLVIATTTEMFRAFETRYSKVVPRVRGDFTPYWEDGAASTARETAINRNSAERLTQAEALWTMFKPSAFPERDFDDAWRNVVLYDEHTWGAHTSVADPDSDFVTAQWAVKQAFALDGERQSRGLLHKALEARGKPVGGAVDVLNTSSWARTHLVTLSAAQSTAGNRVVVADGHAVPSQRLGSGELAFLARNVPAFGSRRYRVVAGAAPPGRASVTVDTLHTAALSVSIDPDTGAISRLQSTHGNLASKLNEYLYVPGKEPGNAVSSGRPTIRVTERGPLVAELEITASAPGANSLLRRVRVVDGMDRVEITNILDKRAIRTKEGVHFGFSFNVPNATVRLDTPWAVVRPEADQLPGACKNWFTVQRWVDVSNSSAGITLATLDAPLVEIGGITAELPWMAHIKPSATIFSYVMNNYWHTNYKADQSGPTTFRYSLQAHGPFEAGQAARCGIEASQPLIVAPAQGAAEVPPRLRVIPSDVIVTSFRPSWDGKAYIIRLFGASGKPRSVSIQWSNPAPKAVYASDLSERRVQRVRGAVSVPAWGMVTLRAER